MRVFTHTLVQLQCPKLPSSVAASQPARQRVQTCKMQEKPTHAEAGIGMGIGIEYQSIDQSIKVIANVVVHHNHNPQPTTPSPSPSPSSPIPIPIPIPFPFPAQIFSARHHPITPLPPSTIHSPIHPSNQTSHPNHLPQQRATLSNPSSSSSSENAMQATETTTGNKRSEKGYR